MNGDDAVLGLRDVTRFTCEARDGRECAVSTVMLPGDGRVKTLASQVHLNYAIARAALVEWDAAA